MSYLYHRQQYVHFNAQSSPKLTVKYGVPQGSVLGPTLFLIFINDIASSISNSSLILFADDTTVLQQDTSFQQLQLEAIDARASVGDWFHSNNLKLNNDKTQNMTFALRDTNHSHQKAVRFLGVFLDPKLTWEEHVIALTKKLSGRVFLLRSLSGTVSQDIFVTAYYGFIHSTLIYAILNWGHSSHMPRAFGLQRKCIRILAGIGYRDCCRQWYRDFGILTLPCVYILTSVLYVKEHESQYVRHDQVHNYPTRYRVNLMPNFTRLLRTRDSTNHLGVKFYNVLPGLIRQLDARDLKIKLKAYLRHKSFYSFEEYLHNDFGDLVIS